MATGYQDISHIAGLVFIKRGFVDKAAQDTAAIRAECPYGDLTDEQLATFEACIKNADLRKIIDQWWTTYDSARAAGAIPKSQPWGP